MTEVANASTTLYLPRQFEIVEMGTVGVALVNPTLTTANLTYKLRSSQGALITTSTGTLAPKGQMAQTLNQIFANATAAGTFSVDIDVEEVTGLWMYGDFVNSTDGARLLSLTDAIGGPAYTFLTSSSEISFMNLQHRLRGTHCYRRDLSLRLPDLPWRPSASGHIGSED